jgi:hypothetical protein
MPSGVFNLHDYAKTFDPKGELYAVARVLDQTNPIVRDAITIESNSDSGHEYAIQNGLPTATWRRAYQGVTPSKGSQTVVKEVYGRMSAVAEVDVAIAEKGGKVSEIRAQVQRDQIEAMNQEYASKFFYGSALDNEKAFVGFAARYNKLSGAKSASNVISNGGSSAASQSSIYLIGWGRGKIFTFFPKGTKAGIKVYDYSKNGPIDLQDANGGTYPGYKKQMEWLVGLAVQDWRYGARVANIQTGSITTTDGCKALFNNFIKAVGRIQNPDIVKLVAYTSREVRDLLRTGFLASGGTAAPIVYQQNRLTTTGLPAYGYHDLVIDGIHVKCCDAIKNTEAVVS